MRSKIHYLTTARKSLLTYSTRHVPSEIHILPGEATHPDRPASPAYAKIYPEAPTPETAQLKFELTGAVAQPEARGVPVDVYITSNHEFSGFAISIKYPPSFVELDHIDEYTRPAAIKLDNGNGVLGMVMANSRRRIGMEGERVRIATLYFNLKEASNTVAEIVPAFESVAPYINWVAIHHEGGNLGAELPIVTEVSPLIVANGFLKIQSNPTFLGDANFDYEVNIADAIVILGDLFLGTQSILCPEAADFNKDLTVNITDPIGILNFLFLGDPAPPQQEIFCNS